MPRRISSFSSFIYLFFLHCLSSALVLYFVRYALVDSLDPLSIIPKILALLWATYFVTVSAFPMVSWNYTCVCQKSQFILYSTWLILKNKMYFNIHFYFIGSFSLPTPDKNSTGRCVIFLLNSNYVHRYIAWTIPGEI